ncbi:MAG: methyltransferase [Planctomycetota bacterium]|jgi:hypothetical protein
MDQGVRPIDELNWGYRASRLLHVACGLDIFTILSKEKLTADQLSKKLDISPEMTEKMLIGCVAMGLLSKDGYCYINTDLAGTYLVKGEPLYQGDMIAHSAQVWNFWSELADHVKGTAKPRDQMPFDHHSFIMGMHNIAVVGRAQMFLDSVDLSGKKQLLDVGGGPGTYSITACKEYPGLQAIVFDLPETIEIARKVIASHEMQDRVTTRPGSWDSDDFGKGNDVVLLSNILHGPNSNAQMKLAKASNSMTAGGLLVVQEFLLDDDKTGPMIPALFNIMVGAYSRAELLAEVAQAGFINAKLVSTSDQIGCNWVTAVKK